MNTRTAAEDNTEIAAARLQGMRGKGGATQTANTPSASSGARAQRVVSSTPPRTAPFSSASSFPISAEHSAPRIVFVGNDWYTQGYVRMFARKWYMTMDPKAENARYGNPATTTSTSRRISDATSSRLGRCDLPERYHRLGV